MILKTISRINRRLFKTYNVPILPREKDPDKVSSLIYNELKADKPSMIARYGATELMCIINYLGVKRGKPNLLKYILGMEEDWWWRESSLKQIEQWSGFFPPTIENVEKFCELILHDSQYLDILASWLGNEYRVKSYINTTNYIQGLFLDPFWSNSPWTKALEDKKILVIHPFEELIKEQYKNREKLFNNPDILPNFDLHTIKAIQSLGGDNNGFKDWFEALDYMKNLIDHTEFDICLLGCGAYGFPLAAHIKRTGKKAVHMGGSLQLLFGIIGKRWENPNYGFYELQRKGAYVNLINEYWIRPREEDKPSIAQKVEGGCYW